jgi:hypothetical protein
MGPDGFAHVRYEYGPHKVVGWIRVSDFTYGYPLGPKNLVTFLNLSLSICFILTKEKSKYLLTSCFFFLLNRMRMNRL